jgi:hypothetical protein
MKKLLLIAALLCPSAFAQTVSGKVSFGGKTIAGGDVNAANIIGLNDFNSNFAESANVLDAMQFVYSGFQQNTAIPNAAADVCSVTSGGKFYIIGGYGASSTTYLNYVQIYDPASDSWSQGATMGHARWGAGCSVYGGEIWVFGGTGVAGSNTALEIYSIAGNSWRTGTVIPVTMGDGTMVQTVGSFIYLMHQGDFYKVDPAGSAGSGSYTALTAAPSAAQVQWAATGYVNVSGDDRIYFIGGSTGSGVGLAYTNINYYYSITNSTWSSAQATAPYSAHGMLQNAAYSGKIYFIAGYDGTYFYDNLYSYDTSSNTWSGVLGAINAFSDGVGGGFIGNTMYVMGGRNAMNTSNPFGITANESFKIGSTPVAQTFTKIQLNYNEGSPSGNVRLGVYSDSSGPATLVVDAGAVAIANGWVSISGLSQSLTVGTRYWLAYVQDTSKHVSYTGGEPKSPTALTAHCFASFTYGALPGTFPASPTCINSSMYAEKLTVN